MNETHDRVLRLW